MAAAKARAHNTSKVADAIDFIFEMYMAGNRHTPVLLAGAPGIGKTEMIQARFKEAGVRVCEQRIGNMDPSDVRGLPIPRTLESGEIICEDALPGDSVLPRTENTILFLDELGHAKTATLNSWMPLLKERRIGNYHAPKDMMIVAATNRVEDRAGSNSLHAAAMNRMIRIDVVHDHQDWLKWATASEKLADGTESLEPRVSPLVTSFIGWKPEALHQQDKDVSASDMPFPSPRSWVNLSKVITGQNGNQVSEKHWLMAANGTIGAGAAIEWKKFHEIYTKLVPWQKIAATPDAIDIPEEPGIKWAYTGMITDIGRRADICKTAQLHGLIKFATRLPADFAVLTLSPLLNKRSAEMLKSPTFKAWLSKNQARMTVQDAVIE